MPKLRHSTAYDLSSRGCERASVAQPISQGGDRVCGVAIAAQDLKDAVYGCFMGEDTWLKYNEALRNFQEAARLMLAEDGSVSSESQLSARVCSQQSAVLDSRLHAP